MCSLSPPFSLAASCVAGKGDGWKKKKKKTINNTAHNGAPSRRASLTSFFILNSIAQKIKGFRQISLIFIYRFRKIEREKRYIEMDVLQKIEAVFDEDIKITENSERVFVKCGFLSSGFLRFTCFLFNDRMILATPNNLKGPFTSFKHIELSHKLEVSVSNETLFVNKGRKNLLRAKSEPTEELQQWFETINMCVHEPASALPREYWPPRNASPLPVAPAETADRRRRKSSVDFKPDNLTRNRLLSHMRRNSSHDMPTIASLGLRSSSISNSVVTCDSSSGEDDSGEDEDGSDSYSDTGSFVDLSVREQGEESGEVLEDEIELEQMLKERDFLMRLLSLSTEEERMAAMEEERSAFPSSKS